MPVSFEQLDTDLLGWVSADHGEAVYAKEWRIDQVNGVIRCSLKWRADGLGLVIDRYSTSSIGEAVFRALDEFRQWFQSFKPDRRCVPHDYEHGYAPDGRSKR
jgi:hypothetical protein